MLQLFVHTENKYLTEYVRLYFTQFPLCLQTKLNKI